MIGTARRGMRLSIMWENKLFFGLCQLFTILLMIFMLFSCVVLWEYISLKPHLDHEIYCGQCNESYLMNAMGIARYSQFKAGEVQINVVSGCNG